MLLPSLSRLLVVVAALLLAPAALAIETGTPAWLIKGQALFQGPGHAYVVTGALGDATRIRVDRCTYRWCQIRAAGQRGWVSRDNVSFGQHPRGPFTGPRLGYPGGGPGQVCFHEGRDFTGATVCAGTGTVVRDLLLFGLDNRYSSVSVEGNVSVTVCRDRDFSSYCERIIESQARLHRFLDNNVTSYRVH
jgi:hypothetical protein